MTYTNPTSADRLCNVCGLEAPTHPRCQDCGIFVGPEHADKGLVAGLCASCWRANQEPGMQAVQWEREAEQEHRAVMHRIRLLPWTRSTYG